jgi:hypothetical protein
MNDDRSKADEPEKQAPVQSDAENGKDQGDADEGRKPPPEDLEKDPAYNPEGPLKGIKGG